MQTLIIPLDKDAIDRDRRQRGGPIRVQCDFAVRLNLCDGQLIDPHTLRVKHRVGGGAVSSYPAQFDEHLYNLNQGWIAWRPDRDDPVDAGEWWIELKLRSGDGRMAKAPPRPSVGVGEELLYNAPGLQPLTVPGLHAFPIPVKWQKNGLVDIISSSHYSNTQGMPWASIFYWRNTGSNARPRFAPPIRVMAQGVERQDGSKFWCGYEASSVSQRIAFPARRDFISEFYLTCDVYDWFDSGREDLITLSREGGIRVYRNTGHYDGAGLPELELAATIPLPESLPPTQYCNLRVIDWDGSGRPSIVYGQSYSDFGIEYGQMLLFLNTGGDGFAPDFRIIPLSRSDRPVPDNLRDYSRLQNFPGRRSWNFDVYDIDHDGRLELLFCHNAGIEVWKNVGTAEHSVMLQQGKLPSISGYRNFGFRFVENAAFDGCLTGRMSAGAGMGYFKRLKDDPFAPKAFKKAVFLAGEGGKVKVEGYVRPAPMDLNLPIEQADRSEMAQNVTASASPDRSAGDNRVGRFSLVCGDEPGFISLIVNRGTVKNPVYDKPRKVKDARGKVVRLCRENILDDGDHEAGCGQLKPQVCDWDNDGFPDIIVANNTNRIFWLKNYDPGTNRIRELQELRVKDHPAPFGWRKGMAIADFNADGRLELVTADGHGRICMFTQTDNPEILNPGISLTFTDGRVITVDSVPPNHYKPQTVWMFAADWYKRGVFDLFIASNYTVSFLENAGSAEKPVFESPRQLHTPDGPLMISHHETQPAVYDWDSDGRPDLLVGGENGGIYLFHRDWLNIADVR